MSARFETSVGTPAWMAPEVLVCAAPDAQGYSFAADVWSAGCVLFAVLTGNLDARNGPWLAEGRGSRPVRAAAEAPAASERPVAESPTSGGALDIDFA